MEYNFMLEPLFDECKRKGITAVLEENSNIVDRYEDIGRTYVGGKYENGIQLLKEELGIEVPFNVKDRVRHIPSGVEYTVVGLPFCDRRKYGEKESYTTGELNYLLSYGNCLWVVDDDNRLQPDGFGQYGLDITDTYYKNFERVK